MSVTDILTNIIIQNAESLILYKFNALKKRITRTKLFLSGFRWLRWMTDYSLGSRFQKFGLSIKM